MNIQKNKFRLTPVEKHGERVFNNLFPDFRRMVPELKKIINEFDPATPQTTVAKAER